MPTVIWVGRKLSTSTGFMIGSRMCMGIPLAGRRSPLGASNAARPPDFKGQALEDRVLKDIDRSARGALASERPFRSREATMHRYALPEWVKERILRRQGKLFAHDTIAAGRSALVVVDMQNYFCAEGFPAEVPLARAIVPNINRLAAAMRAAGGLVVWIQTTATGALEHWGNHHKYMLTPERARKRLASLDEAADGFKLYPALDALPTDLR